LNERALRLADYMAANAATLRIAVEVTGSGMRVLDCGIQSPGGLQAGLGLAKVCLAGLGDVALASGDIGGMPSVQVTVATDQPVAACMASQYAGWQIAVGKFFAMGSGPMRAAYGKEELFNDVPGREKAPVAVGVLETRKLPAEEVVAYLCQQLALEPSNLTLLA